jgi:hypothetical protein
MLYSIGRIQAIHSFVCRLPSLPGSLGIIWKGCTELYVGSKRDSEALVSVEVKQVKWGVETCVPGGVCGTTPKGLYGISAVWQVNEA